MEWCQFGPFNDFPEAESSVAVPRTVETVNLTYGSIASYVVKSQSPLSHPYPDKTLEIVRLCGYHESLYLIMSIHALTCQNTVFVRKMLSIVPPVFMVSKVHCTLELIIGWHREAVSDMLNVVAHALYL